MRVYKISVAQNVHVRWPPSSVTDRSFKSGGFTSLRDRRRRLPPVQWIVAVDEHTTMMMLKNMPVLTGWCCCCCCWCTFETLMMGASRTCVDKKTSYSEPTESGKYSLHGGWLLYMCTFTLCFAEVPIGFFFPANRFVGSKLEVNIERNPPKFQTCIEKLWQIQEKKLMMYMRKCHH